jgi:hypothetical protein
MQQRQFIVTSAHIRKLERSQINNLMIHLKLLEKQKPDNPKSNRRKKIIKVRAKISGIRDPKQ